MLGFACDVIPKIHDFSIHDMAARWFKPLLALFFLPILIQFILSPDPGIFRRLKSNLDRFFASF